MIVAVPHVEKNSHSKLIRDRDSKQFLHSSSGREKLVGFTGDLVVQPYSIDTDFGFLPQKPWHPVDERCVIKEEHGVRPEPIRSNSAKHTSVDYDYAHKQPHSKIRLERQIDKICRYQYKKKHLQSYKEIPSEVRKALMGIEEKPSLQPDITSPYFAIRSWLLNTAPDPELRKWILETKTDSEVRWMLLQEEALHRASQLTMPDPELKRWAKRERAELDRRIEAKAKLKRREDTNEMIIREELAREEKRIQSFQQQAVKRQAIVAPPTVSTTNETTADNARTSQKKGQIMYFDADGVVSLQIHAPNLSCKSLNKIDVTDTLYNKRNSINVALASSGKDMEVNARRRASISPSPLGDNVSRGRVRPQTAGAKLQSERPTMLPVRKDDHKTSMMVMNEVSRLERHGNVDGKVDTDVDDDDLNSMNTGGKPSAGKGSSTMHRERSLADHLPVYHLPTVNVLTPTSTSNMHKSESKSQQVHIHDPATYRPRPKTAGPVLPTTSSSNKGKRSTSRPRSASPINRSETKLLGSAKDPMKVSAGTSKTHDIIHKGQSHVLERPNTAGARLTSQLTNGYEYTLPIVTSVSNMDEKNKISYQLPSQTKKAYAETKGPRPVSAPSIIPLHEYDGHKHYKHSSRNDDHRPHSALYRNALRSTSPKIDPKAKEKQQLQQMFGKDLIYRLDSVFAPKQQPGKQRTKEKSKLTSWRI